MHFVESHYPESLYPLNFRSHDAISLGLHLKLRHSVELVGIKHIGISNFLHFFLYHERIVKTYIASSDWHMFVAVDLNDLTEKEIFPFWVLTFKRLVDKVETFRDFPPEDKRTISSLFLSTIQSRNFFLTIENLRESIKIVVRNNIFLTIFFIRFDRIKDAVSEEFLANLQGLRDATAQKLAFVFTSFRPLDDLAPEVFSRKSLSVFSHVMFVKPATDADIRIVFEAFEAKYNITPSREVLTKLIGICGGHVQYLQISLIIINALMNRGKKINSESLLATIAADERVNLISEEIWESLNSVEQEIVKKVFISEKLTNGDEAGGEYLMETGLVSGKNGEARIFSPLFSHFVKQRVELPDGETVDFTKKENAFFKLLLENLGEICEREVIIDKVWSEYEEMGVSDWTIDQLVARVRAKLKRQKSAYAIKTVRTRGYRLVEES